MPIERKDIEKLVEAFAIDDRAGLTADDPEADTERLYIEPLFEALGWDMRSRDVRKQKVTGPGSRRTDYAFLFKRRSAFVIEAKASSVDLDGHYVEQGSRKSFAEKTIQYAWSATAPVAVLTNFTETRVYNAAILVSDPSDAYLFPPIAYNQLLSRADDLVLLGRTSVETGSLQAAVDRHAREMERPIRKTIDAEILQSLVNWRRLLMIDLAERYEHLAEDPNELGPLIQNILDRLVFVRVLEDLNLQKRDSLWNIANSRSNISKYEQFLTLVRAIEVYFNSGLFEPGTADSIEVSDQIIRQIISDSYRYHFGQLPLDLFGTFYENYIGYIINEEYQWTRNRRRAQAKGIYYTPPAIVDFIVVNTLRSAQATFRTDKLTVLDPACGSGSFTLRAYEELMHSMEDVERSQEFSNSKRFLTEHIFGVDSDSQAVEVAATYHLIGLLHNAKQQPLFLPQEQTIRERYSSAERWHLEDLPLFTRAGIFDDQQEFQAYREAIERGDLLLPKMMGEDSTIRVGNSLVDGPTGVLLKQFRNYLGRDVIPFHWKRQFADVFNEGGFHVVVGNPPYRNMDEPQEDDDPVLFGRFKNYLQTFSSDSEDYLSWRKFYRRMSDLYYFFFFRAIWALREKGYLGLITSRMFHEAHYADVLREFLSKELLVKLIVDFQDVEVFDTSSISSAIIIGQKRTETRPIQRLPKVRVVKVRKGFEGLSHHARIQRLCDHIQAHLEDAPYHDEHIEVFDVPHKLLGRDPWHLFPSDRTALYEKIDADWQTVDDYCIVGQGMQTGANHIFAEFAEENVEEVNLERAYMRIRATNAAILPYQIANEHTCMAIFIEGIPHLVSNSDIRRVPQNIRRWLMAHRSELEQRAAVKRGDTLWFRYSWPLHLELFGKQKLICPYRAARNRFYLDETGDILTLTDTTVLYTRENANDLGFHEESVVDLYYLLGLLNSKLLTFRYQGIGKATGGGMYEYYATQVAKLPIALPDRGTETGVALYRTVVESANCLQELFRKLGSLPSGFREVEAAREEIPKKVEEIDQAVFEIYDLDPSELI